MLEWQKEAQYVLARKFPLTKRVPVVVLDLETSGLDCRTHNIVGISVTAAEKFAAYIPIAHSEQQHNTNLFDVIKQLNDYNNAHCPLWVFYNAKFDLRWLKSVGFSPRNVFDVQLLWYNLMLENAPLMRGLKETARHLLGVEMLSLKNLFKQAGQEVKAGNYNFASLPVDDLLLSYACADADITYRLYERGVDELRTRSRGSNLRHILKQDHDLLLTIMDMEDNGVTLDVPLVNEIHDNLKNSVRDIKIKLQIRIGSDGFNPASPKHLGAFLYGKGSGQCALPILSQTRPTERHPQGNPSTDGATLQKLNRKYGSRMGAIKEILEFREVASRIKFVQKLAPGVSPITGKIHPQYHQARQITGRLSTTGDGQWLKRFNLQGVPKLPAEHPHNIRRAFKASDGFKWVSFDLSNIEIRLIANFSGDSALQKVLLTPGGDLHANTAKVLFGKLQSDPDWDKWRKIAKICNFNLAYAFGIRTLQEKIEVETGSKMSDKACYGLFNMFFKTAYPGWGAYKKDLVSQARKTGKTTTLFGRERDISGFYKGENVYFGCAGDRQAVNHPIQGSCADLLRRALIHCNEYIVAYNDAVGQEDVRMLFTVHDEINFEIRWTTKKDFLDIVGRLRSIIEWTPKDFVVPVKASVSVGDNWGSLEEI